MELKNMINVMQTLRAYDDDTSILVKLKMIEELNSQIKMTLITLKKGE